MEEQSEVARLLAQIAREYESAHQGLYGLASGVSKHDCIQRKYEAIGEQAATLGTLVGEERALHLVCTLIVSLDDAHAAAGGSGR